MTELKKVDELELTRLIEAYDKAEQQLTEMFEMLKAFALISLEPLRDRLEKLEDKLDLKPARPVPVVEEEEVSND